MNKKVAQNELNPKVDTFGLSSKKCYFFIKKDIFTLIQKIW